ncbi:uncharacterized protein CC84DRAFT_1182164 [Paraphaeosphaeria sporulosa]|uniref:Uncharacterized protein n=1 Tax=Paraphaeosphaeria sporulosa TaxID=1460663 RepID=A0A177BVV2_9PLEO|nr:uncharacterized protein CC84DRAFT_1182164 [Paraphaeosphaeria sporulosa]OAF98486.1 hypothetical protein CC84DRAFT_1182164 [Paraphaeosphaeria sporulosa]
MPPKLNLTSKERASRKKALKQKSNRAYKSFIKGILSLTSKQLEYHFYPTPTSSQNLKPVPIIPPVSSVITPAIPLNLIPPLPIPLPVSSNTAAQLPTRSPRVPTSLLPLHILQSGPRTIDATTPPTQHSSILLIILLSLAYKNTYTTLEAPSTLSLKGLAIEDLDITTEFGCDRTKQAPSISDSFNFSPWINTDFAALLDDIYISDNPHSHRDTSPAPSAVDLDRVAH